MAGSSYTQSLVLELLVKSNDLQRGLKQVSGDVDAAGKKLDTFKESAGKALSFVGSVGLGAGVATVLKKTVNAYGEFVNQMATANQVFGDSFHIIEDGMKNSVEAVGLSKTAYLQGTTYIAGLGKAAGITGDSLAEFSQEMVGLGADLAAAFNTSVPDAIAAIQSGFSGSSIEPLRKYNVVINDGALKNEFFALTGQEVTDTLSQQQRAAAFVSLLYKQSADFQGQWNRESGQFNGTMQRLKATMDDASVSIGQSFAPAVVTAGNAVISIIGPLIKANDALGGFLGTMGLGLAAMVALRGPLTALGTAMSGLFAGARAKQVTDAFGVMTTSGGRFTNMLKNVSTGTVILGTALIAYSIISAKANQQQAELNKALSEMPRATAGSKAELESLTTILGRLALANEGVFDKLNPFDDSRQQELEQYREKVEALARTNPEIVAQMVAIAEAGGAGADALARYGLTAENLTEILTTQAGAGENNAKQMERVQAILDSLNKTTGETEEDLEGADKAWDNFTKRLGEIPEAAEDAAKALEELINQDLEDFATRGDLALEELRIGEAVREWADAINKPLEEGETLFDRQILQAETYAGMFDQIASATDTALASAQAFAGHELIGQEKIDFLTNFYNNLKAQYPILAADIDALIAKLPTDVSVEVTAATAGAQAAVDAIVANTDARTASIGMLVKAGSAPKDAAAIVDRLGADNVIEIITTAITTAAEDDITVLSDQERTTDIAVQAVLDAATTDMSDFTTGDYSTDVVVTANLRQAVSDINAMRTAAARPIFVPVVAVGATGGKRPPTNGGNPPLSGAQMVDAEPVVAMVNGEEVTATPTATGITTPGFTSTASGHYMVTAGQPIVHNTTIYQTIPTADPSAVVRALQRWTRSNGSLPITRGRG